MSNWSRSEGLCYLGWKVSYPLISLLWQDVKILANKIRFIWFLRPISSIDNKRAQPMFVFWLILVISTRLSGVKWFDYLHLSEVFKIISPYYPRDSQNLNFNTLRLSQNSRYFAATFSKSCSMILSSSSSFFWSGRDKKKNIKAPRHWPLWGESAGDRWIPHTKDQQRGKCFH